MKNNQIVVWVILGALVAAAAFYFLTSPSAPPAKLTLVETDVQVADEPVVADEVPVAEVDEVPEATPAAVEKIGDVWVTGAVPGEWTMDWLAARILASKSKLPLLLNFTGSDWCGWCQLMDRNVFSKEEWTAFAKERFVLVWIDFPQNKDLVPEALVERNQKMMQDFKVEGFPTFVVVDSDGKTRLGQTGAHRDVTVASFVESLEDVLLASDKGIAAAKSKLDEAGKAALDVAQKARAFSREKLQTWVEAKPEQTDENRALYRSMLEEIEHAEAALMELLKK